MKVKTIAVALFVSTLVLPVLAQTGSTPRIDQRQSNQQQRIDQGVQSGSLTEREAARLEKGQDKVQKIEDKAAADGKVTAKERVRIEKAQDRQSRHIAREKHDRQHDYNRDGRKDRPARKK
ncbi:MAG: hypothetical protein CVU20_13580 [Betaproteobacteria bacterium HGW-Betaproteobacteria-14]|nr:MAG: hypothetical protein CVU20_13580 [Betaproteobacteria bacterium HGW-Betaproteobacteria-14]